MNAAEKRIAEIEASKGFINGWAWPIQLDDAAWLLAELKKARAVLQGLHDGWPECTCDGNECPRCLCRRFLDGVPYPWEVPDPSCDRAP